MSGVYAAWPCFAVTALLVLLAATPLFRLADAPPHATASRVVTLDGLRGFLGLAVFFHHGVVYYPYITLGSWDLPPSGFYTVLGQFGVAVFFMITGYLFWAMMIAQGGRPDFRRLYVGRVFRIGPLYLAAVVGMLLIILQQTGWAIREPVWPLTKELVKWAMLGVFGIGPDINGDRDTTEIMAGVTWSLQDEWLFYAALAVIGFAARWHVGSWSVPVMALASSLACVAYQPPSGATASLTGASALFAIGMGSAALRNIPSPPQRGREGEKANHQCVGSACAVGLLGILFTTFDQAHSVVPLVLIGTVFLLIVSGCDCFGLLTLKASQRLGNISYGIYLLQGLVLNRVFAVAGLRHYALQSATHYWIVLTLSAIILVLAAALAHVLIERPGIALGQALCRRLGARA